MGPVLPEPPADQEAVQEVGSGAARPASRAPAAANGRRSRSRRSGRSRAARCRLDLGHARLASTRRVALGADHQAPCRLERDAGQPALSGGGPGTRAGRSGSSRRRPIAVGHHDRGPLLQVADDLVDPLLGRA